MCGGKGRGGGHAPGHANDPAPFTGDEVIEIVNRAKRAHLGLMENHEGGIICIRAWDFHAGLRDRGILADYDVYSVPIPRTVHPDVPRAAFITAKTHEHGEMFRNGIRGHYPRRDDRARALRETNLRPRLRLYIANPRTYNRARATCPTRHEGMILVDFREVVRNMEVRVAGTPSYYPSVFVFTPTFRVGVDHPQMIPPQAILGFHGFESNTLELISDAGANYQDAVPDLWCWENIALLPEIWPECERRVLRLPHGTNSADIALEAHQRAIIDQIVLHGADGSRLNIDVTRAPVLRGTGVEKGQGKVPSTSAAQTTGKGRGGG